MECLCAGSTEPDLHDTFRSSVVRILFPHSLQGHQWEQTSPKEHFVSAFLAIADTNHHKLYLFVVTAFMIYTSNNLHMYKAVLLTMITTQYFRSPELTLSLQNMGSRACGLQ